MTIISTPPLKRLAPPAKCCGTNFEKPMQVNQSTKHDIKLEIDAARRN